MLARPQEWFLVFLSFSFLFCLHTNDVVRTYIAGRARAGCSLPNFNESDSHMSSSSYCRRGAPSILTSKRGFLSRIHKKKLFTLVAKCVCAAAAAAIVHNIECHSWTTDAIFFCTAHFFACMRAHFCRPPCSFCIEKSTHSKERPSCIDMQKTLVL